MRRLLLVLFMISLYSTQADIASADNLCGDYSQAIQCQSNGAGNGFVNPQMDPRVNPQVDPRVNPMADPRVNPMADPRVNPMADPRVNPMADPCDLKIIQNCKKNTYENQVEPQQGLDFDQNPNSQIDPNVTPNNSQRNPTFETPAETPENRDSGSIPVRNIFVIALILGYTFLWDSSLNLKGNIEKQKNRFTNLVK